ncbi:MAG: flagellar biosynthesis protein FliQ [Rhodospirillales bacterium]|nr:flagellar biosynthesis protein FliQ [Rhodospirillales bacterium]
MNQLAVLEVGSEAVFVVLRTATPIMLAGLVVGLIVALFQALTSVQKLTLTFVPKIIVIFLSIVLFLPFIMTTMIEFSQSLFDRIIALG